MTNGNAYPHLVWVDCEMTGLDTSNDVLVEIDQRSRHHRACLAEQVDRQRRHIRRLQQAPEGLRRHPLQRRSPDAADGALVYVRRS